MEYLLKMNEEQFNKLNKSKTEIEWIIDDIFMENYTICFYSNKDREEAKKICF